MSLLIAPKVLNWFDLHGRKDLPWQKHLLPYPVWVSEIMLQQTQVTTVIPYFKRFMKRFPTVTDLAAANLDEVLALWTGLGYYARARNLHKTAIIIMRDWAGILPTRQSDLMTLPGIGRSTAAAIAAICHGEAVAILDGNVKRVIARHFAIEGWPGQSSTLQALWTHAEAQTPSERIADYTQAMMDLGATVCRVKHPACHACPIRSSCNAKKTGRIDQYPGKKPKKVKPKKSTVMLIVRTQRGDIRLIQRPHHGIWGGLYSFPECQTDEFEAQLPSNAIGVIKLPTFKHQFTHFELTIQPILIDIKRRQDVSKIPNATWLRSNQPAAFGLSRPAERIIKIVTEFPRS
jgi:A/G-specific adenine glycosylase